MSELDDVRERFARAEAELLGTVGAFVDWRRMPDAEKHVEHMAQRIEERFAAYAQVSNEYLRALGEES